MNALDLVQAVEAAGGVLTLRGERVRYGLPEEAATLVEHLRKHKEEVATILREREGCPPMPDGIRMVSWEPKEPPVVLTRWSIVTDVYTFVLRTLQELEAALAGEKWLAGNWSVQELVDRLEQVGVQVEVTL
jgi:hypothetical protein